MAEKISLIERASTAWMVHTILVLAGGLASGFVIYGGLRSDVAELKANQVEVRSDIKELIRSQAESRGKLDTLIERDRAHVAMSR